MIRFYVIAHYDYLLKGIVDSFNEAHSCSLCHHQALQMLIEYNIYGLPYLQQIDFQLFAFFCSPCLYHTNINTETS